MFGIVRSVSACEKCFGFVRIGSLSYWNVRVSVRMYTHAFCHSFEDTKNDPYLVKMPICKSESADLFHLKIQLVLQPLHNFFGCKMHIDYHFHPALP